MDVDPEDFNPNRIVEPGSEAQESTVAAPDGGGPKKELVPMDELLARICSRIVLGLLLFVGFIAGVWVAGVALHDPDTCWLLALGREIVSNHALPVHDPFSWTFAAQEAAGQKFVLYQWLSEVVFYLATTPGGMTGLITLLLLCAVTISTAFLSIPMSLVVRREAPFVAASLAVVLGMLSASFHTLARPEIFSYLFIAIFLQVVHNARVSALQGDKKIFPVAYVLAPLMVLWANMHTGFISGFAILTAVSLGSLLSLIFFKAPVKNLLFSTLPALILCIVAALANPYGLGLYEYIPKLFNLPANKYIIELQPVLIHTTPDLYPFLLLCLVYLFLMAREGMAFVRPPQPFTDSRKLLACELLICFISGQVGIFNGLVHRRVASFVTLILVGEVIALLSLGKARRESKAPAPDEGSARKSRFWERLDSHGLDLWKAGGIFEMAIIALCAVAGVTLVSFRIAKPELPASSIAFKAPFAAIDYIGKNQPKGRLYNDQQFGDLLIYYLPGKPKVFVDTRFDMYGARLVEDYRIIHECEPGWQKLLNDYGVDWVFILPDSLLAEQLLKDPHWKQLYRDDCALILEHSGIMQ